ncbi:hypothetical protein KCU76_g6057, partial [Aureobasidium melanogenum]
MMTKYLPTDTLPYTIECNACGSRFNRMIDWEEHEPIHDVVSDVERPDGSEEPLVFHFDTLGESSPLRAANSSPVQTDQPLEPDDAEDTASAAPLGRVRLPRHVRARGKYIPRDDLSAQQPLQCQWADCNSSFDGDDATQDLYDHLIQHFDVGQKDISCEWQGCTAKPQRDNFYMRIHIQKHADIGGCLECLGGCGAKFHSAPVRTKHHKTCPEMLKLRGNNGGQQ